MKKISLREVLDSVKAGALTRKQTAEKFGVSTAALDSIMDSHEILKSFKGSFPRKERKWVLVNDLDLEETIREDNPVEKGKGIEALIEPEPYVRPSKEITREGNLIIKGKINGPTSFV